MTFKQFKDVTGNLATHATIHQIHKKLRRLGSSAIRELWDTFLFAFS